VFKVIDLPKEGKPQEHIGTDHVVPPPPGMVRWVDLVATDQASLDLLRDRFGFHPLALEDCASFELMSKIEEYPDFLFVVLHTFTACEGDPSDIQIHEVHAFVTESTLVTVHDNPVPAAQQAWTKALSGPEVLARGPCWALYLTADVMVDAIFPLLAAIAAELEEVEEALISREEERDLTRIFQVKRALVNMRRVIRPLRDAIATLSRRGDPRIRERTALYFRDVYDHVLRCAETIEEDLALATHAMDAHQLTSANKTNDVMRRLTMLSAIFLPLTFITGFWGQNFTGLPFERDVYLIVMLAGMVVLPLSFLGWFVWKKWL
jgi:magnesium transporter